MAEEEHPRFGVNRYEGRYCAHCGRMIRPENEENGVYEELRMMKLFCEDCGKTTFVRLEDIRR